MRGIYMWRAWNEDRSRICDAGIAFASAEHEARVTATLCIGGPHAHEVKHIDVELEGYGRALTGEELSARMEARIKKARES